MKTLSGLFLFCWLAASGAVAEERRLALVVGVGAYQHDDPLRNAVADADLIANALEKAGFAVTSERDIGQSQFEHALATFEKEIGPGDTALIYFSGHAVQAANRNVLLAADSQGANGVPFYKLLDATERSKFRILILDACRDNPRGANATAGLKPEYPKGETVIIFSAEAGTEATDGAGPHSPFAASLARHMSDGLELESMMKLVANDVQAATSNQQSPEIRVGGGTAFYFGASFAVQPGLNEPARLIARELEAQFERAGFAADPQRPTIVYDVDADPIALGPVVDQPDHVIVKVTKHWTDPSLRQTPRSVQAEYPWRNPNSSARNAAEQLFRLLLPSVRDEGLPERDGVKK
jgi:Caspase domain